MVPSAGKSILLSMAQTQLDKKSTEYANWTLGDRAQARAQISCSAGTRRPVSASAAQSWKI